MSTSYFLPDDEEQKNPVAMTYWGGSARGCVVEMFRSLRPDQPLVNEYGETMTVAELESKDGKGRRGPEG